jgi:hypothetical protein
MITRFEQTLDGQVQGDSRTGGKDDVAGVNLAKQAGK